MKNTVEFLSRTYPNDKLRGVTLALDTALNGRSLDVDTAEVELTTGPAHLGFWTHEPLPFFTRDRKRFLTSEQTALGAWSRSDALTMRRGGSQYAIMLPSEVTRVGKRNYTVSCTSALGRLVQLPHRGGIYTGSSGGNPMTAGPLIREICGYVNGSPAAGVTVYVAPEFESIAIYGWLPYLSPTGENGAETGSARDNLLQVLFAINACLRDDATGTLRVENLSTEPASTITADRVYREGAQVVEEQPVTAVTVLEHQYIPGADTEVLYEGTTVAGQVVVFSGPMSGLVADGFTITESGANYAVLSAGTGTLTGTPYLDNTIEVTRAVTAGAEPNTERVEQATLVSLTNSGDVADRLAAYYAHRKWIECDAQIEFEDPGDVVSIWDPFDEVQRSACIESISPLVISGVMRGRVSALIGYTPWQTVPFEDRTELITNNTTWRASDHPGVTMLTAYLIGGAQGGSRGEDGQTAPQPSITQVSSTASENTTVTKLINNNTSSAAGAGGNPGEPGQGGNILRVDIPLQGNEVFSVVIGKGGAGATQKGSAGALGTATTFGQYSSAQGSPSEYGFTDPTSGTVYALQGLPGTRGNDGSSKNATPDPIGLYANGAKGDFWSQEYYDGMPREFYAEGQGHYGGGAAAGASGGNATGGESGSGITVTSISQSRISALIEPPGRGANAAAPAKAALGRGGTGGNGGGGNGAYGVVGIICSYNNQTSSVGTLDLAYAVQSSAGNGSQGGDGGDGLVILYYRVPVLGGA